MEKLKAFLKTSRGLITLVSLLLLLCSGINLFRLFNYQNQQDRTPPAITHSMVIPEYIVGEDISSLLNDVEAIDPEDGDVTSEVRIRSIMASDDSDEGVVTYVVKDRANNLMTLKRSITVVGEMEDPNDEANSETANDEEAEQTETVPSDAAGTQ